MQGSDDFSTIWRRLHEPAANDDLALCPVASAFLSKIEEIVLEPLGSSPSRGQIAQAKYMVAEEHFCWKRSVPEAHFRQQRYHPHRCLSDVYDASYQRLHLTELSLRPPQIIADYETVISRSSSSPRPEPRTVIIPSTPFMGLADDE